MEKDIPVLKDMYRLAFAGFPWHEELSSEEIDSRFDKQQSMRGFSGLVGEKGSSIATAHWWDSPTIVDIANERGQELAMFAEKMLADHQSLFWERELLTHPDFQKQGFGTIIRTAFVDKLMRENTSFIVLTRMREDNLPTIKIAQKLGYQGTGIKTPCNISSYLHEYWYLAR